MTTQVTQAGLMAQESALNVSILFLFIAQYNYNMDHFSPEIPYYSDENA